MQQEQKELLQALYEEHQGGLRLIAFSIGVPEHEVDDMIQDTFCAFIDSYENDILEWDVPRRKGTLVRILKNRCADYHRDQKKRKSISMNSGDVTVEYEIMRRHLMRDICDNLIEHEEMHRIQKSIESMKPCLREVAVLFMIEGRSAAEVCEILNISNSAFRMRVFRIRRYMKEQFKTMDQF